MRVLAGDIGGTKTWLALYEDGSERSEQQLPSQGYEGLEDAIAQFLGTNSVDPTSIDAAAFGIAGPVSGEVVRTTNLPWVIDAARLRQTLDTDRVRLLNDFHAAALGLDALGDDDLVVLQEGEVDPAGPSVLIGAGTGLGKAVRVPTTGREPRVLSSEGGHASFAPHDTDDDALLTWMRARQDPVSVEHVVSGLGLPAIFQFIVETERASTSLEGPIDGATIGAAANDGDAAAVKTLEWFARLYGAEAGNLALNVLPTGGLYVAGGIAPKLHRDMGPRFASLFVEGMLAKGRMRTVLETVRVQLVLQPKLGLLGAALAAES